MARSSSRSPESESEKLVTAVLEQNLIGVQNCLCRMTSDSDDATHAAGVRWAASLSIPDVGNILHLAVLTRDFDFSCVMFTLFKDSAPGLMLSPDDRGYSPLQLACILTHSAIDPSDRVMHLIDAYPRHAVHILMAPTRHAGHLLAYLLEQEGYLHLSDKLFAVILAQIRTVGMVGLLPAERQFCLGIKDCLYAHVSARYQEDTASPLMAEAADPDSRLGGFFATHRGGLLAGFRAPSLFPTATTLDAKRLIDAEVGAAAPSASASAAASASAPTS